MAPELVDDGLDAQHEELVPQMQTKLQVVLMERMGGWLNTKPNTLGIPNMLA